VRESSVEQRERTRQKTKTVSSNSPSGNGGDGTKPAAEEKRTTKGGGVVGDVPCPHDSCLGHRQRWGEGDQTSRISGNKRAYSAVAHGGRKKTRAAKGCAGTPAPATSNAIKQ